MCKTEVRLQATSIKTWADEVVLRRFGIAHMDITVDNADSVYTHIVSLL